MPTKEMRGVDETGWPPQLWFISNEAIRDKEWLSIKYFYMNIFSYIQIPSITVTTLCPHNRLVVGDIIFCEYCKDSLKREIERNERRYYFMPEDFERYEYDLMKIRMEDDNENYPFRNYRVDNKKGMGIND